MKKQFLTLLLLASLPIVGCGNNSSSPKDDDSGEDTYVAGYLEGQVITFLNARGISSVNKIDVLHSFSQENILFEEMQTEFDGEYVPYYEVRLEGDYLDNLLSGLSDAGWTVPTTESIYGYECIDPNELMEFDVQYVSQEESEEDAGTWLDVYSYADLYGESGAGGETSDIGDGLEVDFRTLGLIDQEQYSVFTGEKVTIEFTDGTSTPTTYYSNGEALRIYYGGSVTIKTNDGSLISKIVYTWGNKAPTSNTIANVGSYDVDTSSWTGSASSVTLTVPGTSGHWRLQAISVTLKN
ncbi:MAG: hypothetical protein J6M95_02200 [Bacilli bacterium]|nr:hypothetical protein [Bacilli bacterium]